MVTLYTITLTVACCLAVVLVLGAERRRTDESSWLTPSTLAVLSASCATLSTLAYAMAGPAGSNPIPLIIGDVTMPLAIGLIAAAMRRAAGRRHSYALLFLIVSAAVGAVTLLVSVDAGTSTKLAVLALFSFVVAVTCFRGPLPVLGSRLIGFSVLFYGAYCLVRLAGPPVWGADSAVVRLTLTQGPATIVAAVMVAIVAWGSILVIRRINAGDNGAIVTHEALSDWIGALLAHNPSVTAIAVSVPDLSLHRAAFGRGWAQSISTAIDRAMRSAMPVGSVVGKVGAGAVVALQFGSAVEFDELQARIQQSFDGMLPRTAPTDPPDLTIEPLTITTEADVRRYARRARATARRAMSFQGV